MIEIKNISKTYGAEEVLKNISFQLQARQTLSILGKSGCGKTTLLKIMAGLEKQDAGSFLVEEEDLLKLPPQKRGVVYLSQEPLLFPHLNVFQNMAYGLHIRKMAQQTIRKKVERLAAQLDLTVHLNKMAHQLSGGQKQRVSFGRALIINPGILLLDEPFGSLDAHTRTEMQQLYQGLRPHYPVTTLFITHDLKEALVMGDQIARMENGGLQLFQNIEEFVASPGSGAAQELGFWESVVNLYHRKKDIITPTDNVSRSSKHS